MELRGINVPTGQDTPVRILLVVYRNAEEAHTPGHRRGRIAPTGEDVQHHREGGIQVRVPEVRELVLHRGRARGNERIDRVGTDPPLRGGVGWVFQ